MARINNDTRIGDLRTRTIPAVPEHVTIGELWQRFDRAAHPLEALPR